MNTKTKRLEALREREVARWRAAWQRLDDLAAAQRPPADFAVYVRARDLYAKTWSLSEDEEAQLDATVERLTAGSPPEVREAWGAWQLAFFERHCAPAWEPDLTRWPESIPEPPPEPPNEWGGAKNLVQSGDRFEAMAGGWIMVMLLWARGVRVLRREMQPC